MTERRRVVFMGTPDFAVPSLEALCAEGFEVAGVLTQPDRGRGRGRKVSPTPVKAAALKLGLQVLQPAKLKVRETFEAVAAMEPDFLVVVAYGRILGPRYLALPKIAPINVHASLLRRFRGAAPIQWAAALGDEETGVSIMKMALGLDSGPVYSQAKLKLSPEDSAGTLHDKLSRLGAQALVEALPKIASGQLKATTQDESRVVFSPPLTKAHGAVTFSLPARRVVARSQGMSPWPGAFCQLKGKTIKLFDLQLAEGAPSANPGEIISVGDRLVVACAQGAVSIGELQASGKRRLDAKTFSRGVRLEAGDHFEPGEGATPWDIEIKA